MSEKQWIIWLWSEDCISDEKADLFLMTGGKFPSWGSHLEEAQLFTQEEADTRIVSAKTWGSRWQTDIHPRFRYE
jgi:hypothetical protein